MKSRERLIASLSHKEADRVPIDLGAHRSSGMSVQAYKRLREHLELPSNEIYVYDVLQQLAIIEDDLLDLFGVDVVQLGYQYYKRKDYWKDWTHHNGDTYKIPYFVEIEKDSLGNFIILGDEDQEIAIMKKDCLYFEQTYFPYAVSDTEVFDDLEFQINQIMWSRIKTPPGYHGGNQNLFQQLSDDAIEIRNHSDRAIYGIFGGNLFEIGQQAFRTDNFFCEMALNPERIEAFLDKLLVIHMRNLEQYLNALGDKIDVIGFGDDLGMQTGPQISVDMFCRFFKPRYQTMWSYVKSRFPDLKICMHTCGGIFPLIPHLAEAGLDCINPVQITCADMQPEKLKNEYGNIISFWGGGCDTRSVLPEGDLDDILADVKKNVSIFKKNGGFVFQQVHNILANVPPENVVTMMKAAIRFGEY